MCGIFCTVQDGNVSVQNNKNLEECCQLLINRGPDVKHELHLKINNKFCLTSFGAVLWTQGNNPVRQPLIDEKSNILLWNGDIYSEKVSSEKNDAEYIMPFLDDDVENTLSETIGPYSLIFWKSITRELYFCRDPLGRHSLLWKYAKSYLCLSSASTSDSQLQELPAIGIFIAKINEESIDITLRPWSHLNMNKDITLDLGITCGAFVIHSVLSKCDLSWIDKEPSDNDVSYIDVFKKYSEVSVVMDELLEVWKQNVDQLEELLRESVRLRCVTVPPYCRQCMQLRMTCTHALVSILFSGGLDSTILALLADSYIPSDVPIDLLNVSFERKPGQGFSGPDRITGEISLESLKKLRPTRTWNFVKIDVNQEELVLKRNDWIKKLIYPLDTILDDSLGCALWFAARGKGVLEGLQYQSPSRVVLMGMGADELLGGYRRLRRSWTSGGWCAVGHELKSQLDNIPSRNLGRDNRTVADHGLAARLPFLHEPLVLFLHSLPPWKRCYLGSESAEGIGYKLLLRLLAWKLGLKEAATFPKRALQFGSRIANPKEQGHQKSIHLKYS